MALTLATVSKNLIADEGILNLFLNASWQNLLFFVLFAGVIAFAANRLTKPQKEQNQILRDFSSSLEKLVVNNAVDESSGTERYHRIIDEINNIRQLITNYFDRVDRDLKEINNTLIRHHATRCNNKNDDSINILREVTNEEKSG